MKNNKKHMNKKENNSYNNTSNKVLYPSAELLLNTVIKEYDCEYQRFTSLYNRTGIITSILTALIIYGIIGMNIFEFKNLFKIQTLSISIVIIVVIIFFLYVGLIISTFLALYNGFSVLFISESYRFDFDIFSENNMEFQKDVLAVALVIKYTDILKKISNNNDEKVKRYKKLIFWTLLDILFFVFSLIFNQFIVN